MSHALAALFEFFNIDKLGVWSRDEVTGIGFEYNRVCLPGLNNALVGRFPPERLQMLGKVESANKGQYMGF